MRMRSAGLDASALVAKIKSCLLPVPLTCPSIYVPRVVAFEPDSQSCAPVPTTPEFGFTKALTILDAPEAELSTCKAWAGALVPIPKDSADASQNNLAVVPVSS